MKSNVYDIMKLLEGFDERTRNDYFLFMKEAIDIRLFESYTDKRIKRATIALMRMLKKAQVEALNDCFEFMGQDPKNNLSDMYDFIKAKEKEVSDVGRDTSIEYDSLKKQS